MDHFRAGRLTRPDNRAKINYIMKADRKQSSTGAKLEAPAGQVLVRAGAPVILTWLLVPLSFVLPLVDSTRPPYVNLTQTFSEAAYWFAQSGGKFGAPIVGALMIIVLVTRAGMNRKRRWKEAALIALIAVIGAAGGSVLNENLVKAELKVPRPNIVWLAGKDGTGPLGMTPEQFYASGNKDARRKPLMEVLRKRPAPVSLSSPVEAHWIAETGYSFPSGHSYSAMFLSTFFLAIAATYVTTKRIWVFYALLPWALAVCYSRPILRVHTPTDITVGALQGVAIGFLAWAVARATIRRLAFEKTRD